MGPAPTSRRFVPGPTPSSSIELNTQEVGSRSEAELQRDAIGQAEDVAEADDGLRDQHVLAEGAVFVVAQGDALHAAVALADATEVAGTAGDDRAERYAIALQSSR